MNSKRQAGFTIIELLVGVAVIVVLVGLLLAAIPRVRASSLNAKCVSNLRQVGIALHQFAADHNGRIPSRSFNDTSSGVDLVWHRWLVREGYVEASIRPSTGGTPSSPIFYCPAFYPEGPHISIHNYMRYGMRLWAPSGKPFDDTKLLQLAAIPNPANFFLVADSYSTERLSQGYQIQAGSSAWRVHLRHAAGHANTLFADGHVAAKDAAYFETLHQTQGEYGGANGNQPFFTQKP